MNLPNIVINDGFGFYHSINPLIIHGKEVSHIKTVCGLFLDYKKSEQREITCSDCIVKWESILLEQRGKIEKEIVKLSQEWLLPISNSVCITSGIAEFHERELALAEAVGRLNKHIEEYGE